MLNSDNELIPAHVELEYSTSFDRLKNWAYALEVLIVFFTLPHNLHAFGVTISFEHIFSNIFATLGVLVLELTFLFALTHFTHGWLATSKQRDTALKTGKVMFLILSVNSVASSLLYAGWDVSLYTEVFLPITPVVAVTMAGWLLSEHPATRQLGEMFGFIAERNATQQTSALALQRAKNSVQLAGIAAREEREKANLEISQIEQGMEIDQLRNAAVEKAQEWEFTNLLRQSAYKEQARQLHQIAAGEEYQERVRLIVSARINEVLKQLNPTVDLTPPLPSPQMVIPLTIPTPSANGHHKNIPAVTAPAGGGDDLPLS